MANTNAVANQGNQDALLLSGIAILFLKKVKPTGGAVAH